MDKDELFESVFKKHSKQLQNLNNNNEERFIIAFSGVPGSGKTTLAKKIEEKFKAIRISNDEIRSIIAKIQNLAVTDQVVHRLGKEYIIYLLTKISSSPNKLITLDSSIDRTFDAIQNWSADFNYKLIVVKIDFNKEEIIERIKIRNGEEAEFYLKELDRQTEDYKRFNQLHHADLFYNQDDEKLFEELNQVIKSK